MPAIHRLGDPNSAGGTVVSIPQSNVRANGLLISVDGSSVSSHSPFNPPHTSPVTANGNPNVRINGIPINRSGDADSCGHTRASGSPNVFVN